MIEYLDRPPSGWFALDVMQRKEGSRDWVALMVDVDPDDLRSHPTHDYRWLRIPGKYRDLDAAWDALRAMMATRH
jgi:hypothetical protein